MSSPRAAFRSRRSRARRDGRENDGPRWPHVHGLRCRECGREYAAAPIYTCEWCFGPLEVAYDYDAIAAATSREKIAAGPLSLWRYADLLPVRTDAAVDLGTGFTPLVRADRLAAGARPRRGVDEERHPQPDELVQGPGGLRSRWARRSSSGSRSRPARRPATSPTPSPRTRRTPACVSYVFIPAEPRTGQDRHHGDLQRQRRCDRRQLRRCQPPVRGARRAVRVGVRERQHAALLRGGIEDPRVRDRRAARMAGPRPCRRAGRERIAAHQDPEGFPGAAQGRPARRGAAGARVGRAGARLFTGRDGVDRAVRHDPTREAGDTIAKSLAIGNPADGYFALDAVRSSGGAFAAVTDDEVVEGCACSRVPKGSSRRPPAV